MAFLTSRHPPPVDVEIFIELPSAFCRAASAARNDRLRPAPLASLSSRLLTSVSTRTVKVVDDIPNPGTKCRLVFLPAPFHDRFEIASPLLKHRHRLFRLGLAF
jgi:hypothetical protein